jgi:hypothetical protein
MARWDFSGPTFSGFQMLQGAKTAVRFVDASTIGIEIEKEHFKTLVQTEVGGMLPEFTANDGTTYVRVYEWKTKVYCTSVAGNDNDVNTLPPMRLASNAVMRADLKSNASAEDITTRGVRQWTFREGRGSASYLLSEVEVPTDGQPLPFRMWDEPRFPEWNQIQLNLKWENLPSQAECPVLVWDPTFYALPNSGGGVGAGTGPTAGDGEDDTGFPLWALGPIIGGPVLLIAIGGAICCWSKKRASKAQAVASASSSRV